MVAMRAADTWLNQVIADHGSTQSDATVLVERTQAQLAADSSISPGTVAAYLRRLDDEGLVVSRRPLRFRVEVPRPSRSRGHVSTDPTCDADVLSLLAGLLTDPDALANPWAPQVANAVALLADPSRLVENRADRGTAISDAVPRLVDAVPRSLVVEERDQTETSTSSLSRSSNRGLASEPADPRHSDESVATWVARLQRLCDSRRDLTPPGNLTRLIAVFQRHSPEQVERALSKVSLDVEARKITSPVGVLVTAGESAPSAPAHLEYFGSAAADPSPLPTSEHRPVAFEEVTNPDGTTAIRVLS